MGIYVEILIRAPLDDLWRHTQDPALHQRWDLRFTRIEYLPRDSEDQPQRFLYSTRIGFGVAISGEGESISGADIPVCQQTGMSAPRASSLKFWSDDFLSLIREGSGYWKYIPTPAGIRFLTWYDYRTRFGFLGRLIDRALFRPLMGWATAWSFDRLRLWLEKGIEPAAALKRALTQALSRLGLIAIFAWQGLVPKLLAHDPDELALLRAGGIPAEHLPHALAALGIAELIFALILLVFWRARWPAITSIAAVAAASVYVCLFAPHYITTAFNPVTLNLNVALLAILDALNNTDLPSTRNCLRQKP